jgi:hypothetical protein
VILLVLALVCLSSLLILAIATEKSFIRTMINFFAALRVSRRMRRPAATLPSGGGHGRGGGSSSQRWGFSSGIKKKTISLPLRMLVLLVPPTAPK